MSLAFPSIKSREGKARRHPERDLGQGRVQEVVKREKKTFLKFKKHIFPRPQLRRSMPASTASRQARDERTTLQGFDTNDEARSESLALRSDRRKTPM